MFTCSRYIQQVSTRLRFTLAATLCNSSVQGISSNCNAASAVLEQFVEGPWRQSHVNYRYLTLGKQFQLFPPITQCSVKRCVARVSCYCRAVFCSRVLFVFSAIVLITSSLAVTRFVFLALGKLPQLQFVVNKKIKTRFAIWSCRKKCGSNVVERNCLSVYRLKAIKQSVMKFCTTFFDNDSGISNELSQFPVAVAVISSGLG